MTDSPVGATPAPENVTGEIVEDHQFVHRVNHDVNWSVIAGVLLAALVLWLFLAGDGEEVVAEEIENGAESGSEGDGGLA